MRHRFRMLRDLARALVGIGALTLMGLLPAPTAAWSAPNAGGTTHPLNGTTGAGSTNALNAVSCINNADCVAVGDYSGGASEPEATLAETWSGAQSWTTTPSPNPSTDDFLNGVSCPDTSYCVSVGGQSASTSPATSSQYQDLIETWNGASWSLSPSPGASGWLRAVSCVTSSFCVAVGGNGGSTSDLAGTLVETWNGSAWSVTSSPTPVGTQSFSGVSCVSATFCVAVGTPEGQNPVGPTLIEEWNGAAWSVVPGPDPGSTAFLNSVSCVSTSFCEAVGTVPGQTNKPLIETWNGSQWTLVSVNAFLPSIGLNGVSCPDQTDCLAVGTKNGGALIYYPDGSYASFGGPSAQNSEALNGVSCVDASDCLAVGLRQLQDPTQFQATEAWVGYESPPAGAPEVPLAILLPVAGFGVFAAIYVVRRRSGSALAD